MNLYDTNNTVDHYNSSISDDHPSAYDSSGNDLMSKDQTRYGDIDSPGEFGDNQARAYARRYNPSQGNKTTFEKNEKGNIGQLWR